MSDTVRVKVDREVCIGVGQCELLEGDVFRLDDDSGTAVIVGDPVLPRDRAEVVVDKCPSQAIQVSTDPAAGDAGD